jgi:hypothetical protein
MMVSSSTPSVETLGATRMHRPIRSLCALSILTVGVVACAPTTTTTTGGASATASPGGAGATTTEARSGSEGDGTEPPELPMSCADQAGSTTTDVRRSAPSTVAPPTTRQTSSGTEVPDAEPAAHEIPDGSWTGPIEASATGTPTQASGSVYNGGTGTIHVEVHDHRITAGSATFSATSSGTVTTPDGGTGTINGSLSMTDGTVTGDAGHPKVAGSAAETGNISITVHGVHIDKPINESAPFDATLTVTEAGCSEVVATFIPDLNSKTGGRGVFSGTLEWHGEREP